MIYRKIDGVSVSSLILGTDYYGSTLTKKECFRMYDIFTDCGGNHIDTAHLYVNGESERILGGWLKEHGRNGVYVATKGAHPPINDMTKSRLTRNDIRSDLEESLTRLGIDCIDLYWLHRDNPTADTGEVIEILNECIKEGKIRSIGCSNWRCERIAQANEYARKHGLKGFSASQIKWSFAVTSPQYHDDPTLVEMNETEHEFYKNSGLPVAAFASQGKGFFSKLDTLGVDVLADKAKERYLCDENLKRFEKVKQISQEYGISIGAAALALLTSDKEVTAMPIIGCKNEEQLRDSLSAADMNI